MELVYNHITLLFGPKYSGAAKSTQKFIFTFSHTGGCYYIHSVKIQQMYETEKKKAAAEASRYKKNSYLCDIKPPKAQNTD